MCSLTIVVLHPVIQVSLQLVQRVIQFPPERNLIKLLQHGFMKALADTICLRMPRFGLGMLYAVYTQIQLVIVRLQFAAVFGSSVRKHADNAHSLGSEKGQNLVIQKVCPGNGRLGGIKLGCRPLGIGIHKALLIYAAHALDSTNIKGVLRAKIAGMVAFYLAAGLVILLFAL